MVAGMLLSALFFGALVACWLNGFGIFHGTIEKIVLMGNVAFDFLGTTELAIALDGLLPLDKRCLKDRSGEWIDFGHPCSIIGRFHGRDEENRQETAKSLQRQDDTHIPRRD